MPRWALFFRVAGASWGRDIKRSGFKVKRKKWQLRKGRNIAKRNIGKKRRPKEKGEHRKGFLVPIHSPSLTMRGRKYTLYSRTWAKGVFAVLETGNASPVWLYHIATILQDVLIQDFHPSSTLLLQENVALVLGGRKTTCAGQPVVISKLVATDMVSFQLTDASTPSSTASLLELHLWIQ